MSYIIKNKILKKITIGFNFSIQHICKKSPPSSSSFLVGEKLIIFKDIFFSWVIIRKIELFSLVVRFDLQQVQVFNTLQCPDSSKACIWKKKTLISKEKKFPPCTAGNP